MKNICIGIDYDGILFNSVEAFLKIVNSYTGCTIELKDITQWDISKIYPKQYEKLVNKCWLDDDLWKTVQPLYNSQYITKLLSKDNTLDLFIVTDTSPETVTIKTKLLNKEYPWFDTRHNWISACNKQMVNVDILIDDKLQNLIGGNYFKILFDYPYNRDIDDEKYGIHRVNNWEEAYSLIKKYKGE